MWMMVRHVRRHNFGADGSSNDYNNYDSNNQMPAAPLCNCLCVMLFTDSGGSDWDCDSGDAAAGEVLVRTIISTQTVIVHGHL